MALLPRAALRVLTLTLGLLAVIGPGTASARHYDRLLPSESACPGQSDTGASPSAQRAAMRCLHKHARTHVRSRRLSGHGRLNSASAAKARDLMRCGEFSHTACGREWDYWMARTGYASSCHGSGENIAWGSGRLGSARSSMSAWLHSDGHRQNILDTRFRDLGVGLVRGRYRGYDGAQVWVTHFGYRC